MMIETQSNRNERLIHGQETMANEAQAKLPVLHTLSGYDTVYQT